MPLAWQACYSLVGARALAYPRPSVEVYRASVLLKLDFEPFLDRICQVTSLAGARNIDRGRGRRGPGTELPSPLCGASNGGKLVEKVILDMELEKSIVGLRDFSC